MRAVRGGVPAQMSAAGAELSAYGVHPARYTGEGCTGCGICFYCCPEPGAITVYRVTAKAKVVAPLDAKVVAA